MGDFIGFCGSRIFMLSGIRRELDELKETLAEGMASHGSDAEKLPKS